MHEKEAVLRDSFSETGLSYVCPEKSPSAATAKDFLFSAGIDYLGIGNTLAVSLALLKLETSSYSGNTNSHLPLSSSTAEVPGEEENEG